MIPAQREHVLGVSVDTRRVGGDTHHMEIYGGATAGSHGRPGCKLEDHETVAACGFRPDK